ncbi:MAG: UDP-N-acetylmuramate--L-alanine ligase [Bacteroidales bacterium]|nr:UDP-N-acetylmuramate--L-alanine ligase [Bacteroidales bacterium]
MNYYFLGIGGIGMSALARYFKQRGDVVNGYDLTESELTRQLVAEGIGVHYDDNPNLIPQGIDMVIYTPAVPKENNEFQHLAQSGIPMLKRSQMLGELTKGKKCIAVAGTHGKTTTSSMIAYLLSKSDLGCSAFLGGISKNFNSNIHVDNKSEYVVVEADEYDRSFLQLHPYCAVITATDPDHLDIYGTHENLIDAFYQFANQTVENGKLIVKNGLLGTGEHHHEDGCCHHEEHEHHHEEKELKIKPFTYTARGIDADYYAINVRNYNGDIFFDLRTPQGVFYDMQLTNSCLYNVENAVAASAVALSCGLNEQQLRFGLKTFSGVRRRFDYRVKTKDIVFIDDYAHHPKEISATLESIRYLFPGKRVVGIFQPHLYSRTADFAPEFAEALSTLDEIILLPIYPAREKPIPGVSSHTILHKIDKMSKYLCSKEQLMELVPALYPEVLVTLGAGDIDRLVPQLEKLLTDN